MYTISLQPVYNQAHNQSSNIYTTSLQPGTQPVYNQAHNQSSNIYTTSLQSGTQPVYNQAHKGIYQY